MLLILVPAGVYLHSVSCYGKTGELWVYDILWRKRVATEIELLRY